MHKWIRSIIALAAFTIIVCLRGEPTQAQDEFERYFEETGHWVSGDFLDTYNSVDNPELIFGNPITEPFQNDITGRFIQYFERARFELRPENPLELRVHQTRLGEFLHYRPGSALSIPSNFPACQTFDETGYQICYDFLKFFHENGGIAQFGYPISAVEIREDRIVQWFQRARFEWHPENPIGQQVTLANLGLEYFDYQGEDERRKDPVSSGNLTRIVTRLTVRAFVDRSVMPETGTQTVYVLVRDQKLVPVARSQVIVTIRYPSGNELVALLPLTDENGLAKLSFPVSENDHGIAIVKASASYDFLEGVSKTSFRIWW